MFAFVVLSATLVWPPPRHLTTSGAPLAVGAIDIQPNRSSARLSRTIERFLSTSTPLTLVEGSQLTLRIDITGPASDDDAAVTSSTCNSYSLRVRAPEAIVTSCSVHGAAYALETIASRASHSSPAVGGWRRPPPRVLRPPSRKKGGWPAVTCHVWMLQRSHGRSSIGDIGVAENREERTSWAAP